MTCAAKTRGDSTCLGSSPPDAEAPAVVFASRRSFNHRNRSQLPQRNGAFVETVAPSSREKSPPPRVNACDWIPPLRPRTSLLSARAVSERHAATNVCNSHTFFVFKDEHPCLVCLTAGLVSQAAGESLHSRERSASGIGCVNGRHSPSPLTSPTVLLTSRRRTRFSFEVAR